jgi:hypothetical protein
VQTDTAKWQDSTDRHGGTVQTDTAGQCRRHGGTVQADTAGQYRPTRLDSADRYGGTVQTDTVGQYGARTNHLFCQLARERETCRQGD